jgi:hypothetical protein
MATTTLTDLPSSRALDYKARSAIRGAGAGDWVLSAFVPYRPPVAPIAPIVPVINYYQTNYIAQNMTLQMQNISVNNLGAGAVIAVAGLQNNALTDTASTAG